MKVQRIHAGVCLSVAGVVVEVVVDVVVVVVVVVVFVVVGGVVIVVEKEVELVECCRLLEF